MKTNLTILFIFIFCNITFAQNETETKHTISVNINYILDQWISKPSELSFFGNEPDHSILAMYKIKHQGVDWRFGIAGLNRKESTLNGILGTSIDKQYRTATLSMGVQQTKNLWQKWAFISGADLIFKYQNLIAELEDGTIFFIETNKAESKKESIGLSTFMGIQYLINQQISLSTEFSFLLQRTSISTDGETQLFRIDDPITEVPRNDTIYEINMIAPLALYLNFHF